MHPFFFGAEGACFRAIPIGKQIFAPRLVQKELEIPPKREKAARDDQKIQISSVTESSGVTNTKKIKIV